MYGFHEMLMHESGRGPPEMLDDYLDYLERETDWGGYSRGHGVAKHYGLRTDRYTLAHFYQTDEWELYDLEKDPHQLRSVYSDPTYAKRVAGLKDELKQLRKEFKDE